MAESTAGIVVADPLAYLASINYRWGQLQAIRYCSDMEIFSNSCGSYLSYLYERTRSSGRSRLGSLPLLFCGMMDLSCEAIVSYLHQRAVVVLGEWRAYEPSGDGKTYFDPYFHPLGYCFPSTPIAISRSSSAATPRNSVFAGYGFFQEAWGTPAQTILSWLGIAWLFNELQLSSIHGVRLRENVLTARWCGQFGFRTIGSLPDYMPHYPDGELVEGIVSTLSRAEFSRRLGEILAEVEQLPEPPPALPASSAPPVQP
jgi:hypothetical protein